MTSSPEPKSGYEEARFSFLLGGYVEDAEVQGNDAFVICQLCNNMKLTTMILHHISV